MNRRGSSAVLRRPDATPAQRIARSAATVDGTTSMAEVRRWIALRNAEQHQRVRRIPFRELRGWQFTPDTGDLVHESGRFFRIAGLHVRTDSGPIPEWSQPIIVQPEIGILGILVREIDGVLHCLMQAKAEPGNVNGVQLSPTVQATKSNYTRVHRGRSVPYLDLFRDAAPGQVLADVLQSEQGSWFYRKRNRNMVVEVDEPIPVGPEFRWLTLGQIGALLAMDNVVNMDARTVLSCLPSGVGAAERADSDLAAAIVASAQDGSRRPAEVLSWITDQRARRDLEATPAPLREVQRWHRGDDAISHELAEHFSVVAVDVAAEGREVGSWSQPLVEPRGVGLCALLVRRVAGVLQVLLRARCEPGFVDVVELGPTVQCTPETYARLTERDRPPFLDIALGRRREQVLYSAELSEEGGRFLHARGRYEVIEVDPELFEEDLPDFRWLTLNQVDELLKHCHYLNVQARSLIACLRGRQCCA